MEHPLNSLTGASDKRTSIAHKPDTSGEEKQKSFRDPLEVNLRLRFINLVNSGFIGSIVDHPEKLDFADFAIQYYFR